MLSDEAFLKKFEASDFKADEWHHREHIRAAYLYLRLHPFEAAVQKMTQSIKALNAAHRVPEIPGRGYHETMTQAWMRLVHCTLCEFGPAETADAFLDQHTQLLSKRALYLFYSESKLKSLAAQQQFVEPDLSPLPASAKYRK